MAPRLFALLAGALFGVGLCLSGMCRPDKVIGFLDVFGAWDASLAFVMGGAVTVYAVASRLVARRASPLLGGAFQLPTRTDLDARLLVGAAVFGLGWGLGGYCPGPGLVSAASGSLPAAVFVVGMSLGLLAAQRFAGDAPSSRGTIETSAAATASEIPPRTTAASRLSPPT
jgi:uncharacterized membrane protein YedE/YeeE